MRSLIERLHRERTLSPDEFRVLLSQCEEEDLSFINTLAREVAQQNFGNKIFIRGLIEVGNRCKNDCYYCGIRRRNQNAITWMKKLFWHAVGTVMNWDSGRLSSREGKSMTMK